LTYTPLGYIFNSERNRMNTQHQKLLINRLHRLEGQLKGVEKMVNENKYCVDIITQSLAIQKSLQSFNQTLLENHLTEHVAHQYRNRKDKQATAELLKIYKLSRS